MTRPNNRDEYRKQLAETFISILDECEVSEYKDKEKLPILLRVLINILIWLIKVSLVLLSFPLQVLTLFSVIGSSIITVIFGFLGFAAICLFLFAPDTRGDMVPLVLALFFGGISVISNYIPEWISNAVVFLLKLKNSLRYI